MDNSASVAIEVEQFCLWYGDFQALFDVNLKIKQGIITALIGPSGCGKTTFLRSVNRINERLGYVKTSGRIKVLGHDVCGENAELIQVRKRVGMVFQRPNPLPLSVRENVLFGARIHHAEGRLSKNRADELVERALREVLLWDTVKDQLHRRATELSLEQQQKLCIARILPVKPTILLMDEPCSALDPKATEAIEELIWDLRGSYSIVIVTHNMAQARRASDECAFMLLGELIEHAPTDEMFVTPRRQETSDYIEGKYG